MGNGTSTVARNAARLLLAVVVAIGLVPTVSLTQSFAAAPKFIGEVNYDTIAYDENGFPLYNEDGTYQKGKPIVVLRDVENVSGTLTVPETFDVVCHNDDGSETVEKNVTPGVLSFYAWFDGQEAKNITAIDVTRCSSVTSMDFMHLDSVKSINMSGLSNLTTVSFSDCESLQSVSTEDCSNLSSYDADRCNALTTPDFSQPQWRNLERLRISSQDNLASLDVSALSELVNLDIYDTHITSLDVSRNQKLEQLSVMSNSKLTSLDAQSIPTSVKRFDCRFSQIKDTAALVERFGGDSVLPQGSSFMPESKPGLHVVSDRDANSYLAPGDSQDVSLEGAYTPSKEENSNYFDEIYNEKNALANFSVTSSDPSIVAVNTFDNSGQAFLRITAKKAGTAKLTINYRFEGGYATYTGQQVVDFTVAPSANPIASIECASSVESYIVSDCAICGASHTGEDAAITVPLKITGEDSRRMPSQKAYVMVESADSNVVTDGSYLVRADGADNEYAVKLYPNAAGSTTVTLTGVLGSERSKPVTIQVNVKETPDPTLKVSESFFAWMTESDIDDEDRGAVVVRAGSGIAEYELNDASAEILRWHNYFPSGSPEADPGAFGTTYVFTASSDNEEVVTDVLAERHDLRLLYKGAGTANVTVSDVWGNTGTCKVTLVDTNAEAKKLSLSKHEVTIKRGETFDLSTLVQGKENIPPELAETAGLFVFESGDGYIAPIKYNTNEKQPLAFSQILGRNVGDVTVTANVVTDGERGGSPIYADWTLAKFGTLTVHVVDSDTPADNPATAVEVSGASHAVELGSTLQLSATVTPSDADNSDQLAWSSSNEAVAAVDASGKVTPVAPGKATITAKVGEVSGTFEVTVVSKAVPATSIELSPAETAMKVGETQKLEATVEPADSTDEVVWSSSDDEVLTVNQSGLVTAVGNGSAAITVSAGEVSSDTDAIQVTTPVTGVTLDAQSLELYTDAASSQLIASIEPSTASNKEVTWTSSDESVATVDAEGNVTPVAVGSAAITATTVDGGFEASCEVEVKQHVTGLALDKHEATIVGAGNVSLKATIEPDNATNTGIMWSTSDEDVATVDADGVVTAVGRGSATVTATSQDGDFSDTCAVTVLNPATSIAVSPSTLDLLKGETADAKAELSGALPGAVDEVDVTWETSDASVATVEDGTVKALKSGSATITAKAGSLVATCTVKVTNPVQAVVLSDKAKAVTVGDAPFTLTATVDPADADDTNIVWSTSNADVASVDADGTVTIKAAGKAVIAATAGSKSATCTVTVGAKQIAQTPQGSGFAASVTASDAATVAVLDKFKDDGLNLVVQTVNQLTESAKEAIEKLTANGAKIAETFDIHFTKDNGEDIALGVNDEGAIVLTVKVKLTDAMRALLDQNMMLQVHYVGEDGTIEDKQTWVEGDYVCFVTEHFSDYVVTGVPQPVEGEGEGEGGKVQSGQNDAPLAKTEGGQGDKLASTGDSLAGVPLACGLLACLAVGALALVRRRVR